MQRKTVGSFIFAISALVTFANAQISTPAPAALAQQVQRELDRVATPGGPGGAILVAQGDRILYRNARGRANIELGVPLSPDQVFRIASITKMFTAAMVLRLAEQHKLSLDDTLATYVPDFPNAANPGAGQITIRQVLSHTSGISDRSVPPPPGSSVIFHRDVDTAAHIAEIRRRPLDFAPGTSWAYSNAGFILLGAVIEKVTGKSWHAAIEEAFLIPLGMTHTRYADSGPIIPGRASGYTTDTPNHVPQNAPYISITVPGAAGGLESTVDDLRLWMRALVSGRVISNASFQQMITPAPLVSGGHTAYSYGLGTYIWHVRGSTMFGHTGQIDGFASSLVYLPERDITIVALGNNDNFDANTMGRRLAAIALGKPFLDLVTKPLSPEVMHSLVGKYQRGSNTVETLSIKDNTLFAQRNTGNVIPLQSTVDGQLHLVPDELTYFVPVRDPKGTVIRLDYFENGDGPPIPMPRK